MNMIVTPAQAGVSGRNVTDLLAETRAYGGVAACGGRHA